MTLIKKILEICIELKKGPLNCRKRIKSETMLAESIWQKLWKTWLQFWPGIVTQSTVWKTGLFIAKTEARGEGCCLRHSQHCRGKAGQSPAVSTDIWQALHSSARLSPSFSSWPVEVSVVSLRKSGSEHSNNSYLDLCSTLIFQLGEEIILQIVSVFYSPYCEYLRKA